MRVIFTSIFLLLVLAGCATPNIEYYYGKYSATAYKRIKDQTPKSLAAHKDTLETIIEKSNKKNLRVPPGIYCEYGYILAQEEDPNANNYFALEIKTYPESETFVSFVRSQLDIGSK